MLYLIIFKKMLSLEALKLKAAMIVDNLIVLAFILSQNHDMRKGYGDINELAVIVKERILKTKLILLLVFLIKVSQLM